jgi:hypothetical protein
MTGAVAGIGPLNNNQKIMNAAAGLQMNADPSRIAATALPVIIRALHAKPSSIKKNHKKSTSHLPS